MKIFGFIGFFVLSFSYAVSHAVEPNLMLGSKGKELLSEDFSGNKIPEGWKANTGAMVLEKQSLRLSELASDKHIGAYRKTLPLQDMAIQVDFQFDNARMFNLGFDPSPGQLKKKGHLYAITISPNSWSIVENNDKSNPESKSIVHAKGAIKVESGKWYTLTLENKGEDVVASISGFQPLKAKAADFKVKKPALVFRAGGEDAAAVLIDNLRVWELD